MCTLATYDRGTALSSWNKVLVSAQVSNGNGSSPMVLRHTVPLKYAWQEGHLVELNSSASIFNGVMGVLLDVLLKQVAGQEAQAQLALSLEVEQEHRVNHLCRAS